MTRLAVAVLIGLVLLTPAAAHAFPGEYRVVHGTLVWPEALSAATLAAGQRTVLVQGDLGTRYSAELTATTEVPAPLRAGARVVVVGREGQQTNQVIALRIESPSPQAPAASASPATRPAPAAPSAQAPARAAPQPPAAPQPAAAPAPPAATGPSATAPATTAPPTTAPTATTPTVASPPAPPGPRTSVEGAVTAVSGSTLVLRTRDGRNIAVDISALDAPVRAVLLPGREVGVFGVVVSGAVLVAQGIELEYVPAALPGR